MIEVMEDAECTMTSVVSADLPEAISAHEQEVWADLVRDEWDQDCYWSL
jgi:hypothetical protein